MEQAKQIIRHELPTILVDQFAMGINPVNDMLVISCLQSFPPGDVTVEQARIALQRARIRDFAQALLDIANEADQDGKSATPLEP